MRFRQIQEKTAPTPKRTKTTLSAPSNGEILGNPYRRFYTQNRTFAALVAAKKQSEGK